MQGGELIKEARRRAGLSQRELAARLKTSQSVIARWEKGARSPTFTAVVEAVRACGLDLGVSLAAYDRDHDALIDDMLSRSPEERLDDMVHTRAAMRQLVRDAERIGRSA